MNEALIWWGVQFFLSSLDFVMMYFISHTLLKKYIIVKYQHILLVVTYTIIASLTFYFLDGFSARITNYILFLTMFKFTIWRSSLNDLIVIYLLSFIIMVGIAQSPIVFMMWLITQLLEIRQSLFFIIVQGLTFVAVIFLCKKFKWHKLFYAVQVNIVLKLILVMFAFFIFIIIIVLNLKYNVLYLFFSALGILVVGGVLFPVIVKLYKNTLDIMNVHDLKNELLSTAFAMKEMDDPEEIKMMYNELAMQFGIDVGKLNTKKAENAVAYMDAMGENINEFIRLTSERNKKAKKIISDITYFEQHEVVDYKTALKWLGTLLDNALDASDQNTIYVSLFSIYDDFTLKVANEYTGEGGKDISVIFEKGYTTKEDGQGIGLHNLYTHVMELGGDVKVEEYYTESHNCHYLQIDIIF